VDGSAGDAVSAGSTRVTFSTGAFNSTRTIRTYNTSNDDVSRELHPEELRFRQPVTLRMQPGGTSLDDSTATVDRIDVGSGSGLDLSGM
jgi:hypothetical protein